MKKQWTIQIWLTICESQWATERNSYFKSTVFNWLSACSFDISWLVYCRRTCLT